MLRRRAPKLPTVDDLVCAVGPAVAFVTRPALLGQPTGQAAFIRFDTSAVCVLPPPQRELLAETAERVAKTAPRPHALLLAVFASAVRSGLPAAPGLLRDGLCLLAQDRLEFAATASGADSEALQVVAEELVVAALGVASAGEIRTTP